MSEDSPAMLGDYEFNHALYHHLGHWAAYVAMMGLLATFGLVIALSPTPTEPLRASALAVRGLAAIGAIVVICGFAVFFTTGMDRYGGLLHRNLGPEYLEQTLYWEHQRMIKTAQFAAFAAGLCDIGLLVLIALWK